MTMLRLSRIFKNYNETGSLSEQINLYGFIGPHVFLTKSGEVGVILEVRGVDYECLDGASIDGFTKRLESALKLFNENYRVYQYLFKRNNETSEPRFSNLARQSERQRFRRIHGNELH
jgi:type IV secretion system protein TrbE